MHIYGGVGADNAAPLWVDYIAAAFELSPRQGFDLLAKNGFDVSKAVEEYVACNVFLMD